MSLVFEFHQLKIYVKLYFLIVISYLKTRIPINPKTGLEIFAQTASIAILKVIGCLEKFLWRTAVNHITEEEFDA